MIILLIEVSMSLFWKSVNKLINLVRGGEIFFGSSLQGGKESRSLGPVTEAR